MNMVLKTFLNNARYSFVIAKIATVFQTVMTLIIGFLLLLAVNGISYSWNLLIFSLLLDISFVCIHLIYRGSYSGKKVELRNVEKHILLWHVISSLLALFITSYIAFGGLQNTYEWMCLALSSWIVSLVSGVIFFIKKYY